MEKILSCTQLWQCASRIWGLCMQHNDTSVIFPDLNPLEEIAVQGNQEGESYANLDLADLLGRISTIYRTIEHSGADRDSEVPPKENREFWVMLSDIPVLKELFTEGKPNPNVLEPFFPKEENDVNSLAYVILRDISSSSKLPVVLVSMASVLERWQNITKNRDECLDVLRQMWAMCELLCKQRSQMTEIKEIQEDTNKAVEMLLEASLMCWIQANPANFAEILRPSSYRESLMWMRRRLEETNEALDKCIATELTGIRID